MPEMEKVQKKMLVIMPTLAQKINGEPTFTEAMSKVMEASDKVTSCAMVTS